MSVLDLILKEFENMTDDEIVEATSHNSRTPEDEEPDLMKLMLEDWEIYCD